MTSEILMLLRDLSVTLNERYLHLSRSAAHGQDTFSSSSRDDIAAAAAAAAV